MTRHQWHIHSDNNNSWSDSESTRSLVLLSFFHQKEIQSERINLYISKCSRLLQWIEYHWKDKIRLQITCPSHRSLRVDTDAIGRKSSLIDIDQDFSWHKSNLFLFILSHQHAEDWNHLSINSDQCTEISQWINACHFSSTSLGYSIHLIFPYFLPFMHTLSIFKFN